jgi:hypothetical protein
MLVWLMALVAIDQESGGFASVLTVLKVAVYLNRTLLCRFVLTFIQQFINKILLDKQRCKGISVIYRLHWVKDVTLNEDNCIPQRRQRTCLLGQWA